MYQVEKLEEEEAKWKERAKEREEDEVSANACGDDGERRCACRCAHV